MTKQKQTLLLVLLAAAGFILGLQLANRSDSEYTRRAGFAPSDYTGVSQLKLPDPELSPREVVAIQVAALQAYRNDPAAVAQCFAMASPVNRAVTGPLVRFSLLVQNDQYRPLITASVATIGDAVVRGDSALVTVTLSDPSGQANVFHFFLSRQKREGLEGCWMTDAVFGNELDPPLPNSV
jgi:hypothetical protein